MAKRVDIGVPRIWVNETDCRVLRAVAERAFKETGLEVLARRGKPEGAFCLYRDTGSVDKDGLWQARLPWPYDRHAAV